MHKYTIWQDTKPTRSGSYLSVKVRGAEDIFIRETGDFWTGLKLLKNIDRNNLMVNIKRKSIYKQNVKLIGNYLIPIAAWNNTRVLTPVFEKDWLVFQRRRTFSVVTGK